MENSDREFEMATIRGAKTLAGPHAVSVRYDMTEKAVVLGLPNGVFVGLPADRLEGLQGATDEQLGNVVLEAKGLGLFWPDIDADLYVPALLQNIFGSKKWMAAQLGASGGKTKSAAKAHASRVNGRKGGRPRKNAGKQAA